MTEQSPSERHTLPAAAAAGMPAAPATLPASLDAHGFDPAEFEWRPVPRRPRADGWTPDVQRAFIEALARTGVVEHAAREVDRSVKSAYALRNAPGGESFARAWTAACRGAADRLLDIAFARAIEGEEVPIYDQDGVRTGVKWRYNTRLTMFLLRAYHPDRFGPAGRDAAAHTAQINPARIDAPTPVDAAIEGNGTAPALPHTPTPPQPLMAQAVAALGPVVPDAPHLFIRPEYREGVIAAARRSAAFVAANPRDGIEGFRHSPVPTTDPRVANRATRRRLVRERREDAENARIARDAGDTGS